MANITLNDSIVNPFNAVELELETLPDDPEILGHCTLRIYCLADKPVTPLMARPNIPQDKYIVFVLDESNIQELIAFLQDISG